MNVMTAQDAKRLQAYLQKKFENQKLTIRARERANDSVEVLLDGEFMGIIYKDGDDGDISYDLNISILEIDLPG